MQNKNSKAFTLVELIVVITILAILGTIAFMAMQGYSSSARDSRRVADVNNIKTSLELFNINTGYFPFPDNGQTVSYSGETLRTQGTIGDNVTTNLSKNLNKKPTDPLLETEYTYSITSSKKEYQILSFFEGNIVMNSPQLSPQGEGIVSILTKANAVNYIPKLEGNYNEIFVKSVNYIVPTPSIINAEINGTGLILNATNIKSQIITSGENFPSISGTTQTKTGGLDINFIPTPIITKDSTNVEKIITINAIQNTYSGTILANRDIYKKILESPSEDYITLIDNIVLKMLGKPIVYENCEFNGETVLHNKSLTTYENESVTYGNTCNSEQRTCNNGTLSGIFTFTGCIVEGATGTFNLSQTGVIQGTNVTITNNCSISPTSYTSSNTGVATISGNTITTILVGTTDIIPVGGACGDNNTKILTVNENLYASCSAVGQIKTATTTYNGCNTADIIVCTGNKTGYILSACNVGSTIAGTSSASYGNYFQWGNNYGFIDSGATSATLVDASGYGPSNYYNSSNYILGNVSYRNDWTTIKNNNLWGNTTNTFEARKGPCANGYHIPTQSEWSAVVSAGGWGNNGINMQTALKLPYSGGRTWNSGGLGSPGVNGFYWTSSPVGDVAYDLFFYSTFISPTYSGNRAYGFSIRCFRN